MSTRSGKRIHRSLHEDGIADGTEVALKNERRTSRKRLKENDDQFEATVLKSKKRKNYVSYPKDDPPASDAIATDVVDARSAPNPKLRRNTLKDLNVTVPTTEQSFSDDTTQVKRITRRTKKYAENIVQNGVDNNEAAVFLNGKSNKGKKNKSNMESTFENGEQPAAVSKKLRKKKKGKRSTSITEKEDERDHVVIKSNISSDSFHSALASPPQTISDDISNDDRNMIDIHPTSFDKTEQMEDLCLDLNNTITKDKKNRSGTLDVAHETVVKTSASKRSNSFFDNTVVEMPNSDLDATFNKELKTRKSLRKTGSIVELLQDKAENLNRNETFEKQSTTRKSFRRNGSVAENANEIVETANITFEISNSEEKTSSHNSTYDKETKLESTFDKTNTHRESSPSKSSIISSDGAINVTYDKSDENPQISITSDDSKVENIVNISPVVIESSMDEFQIDDSTSNVSKSAPSLVCSPKNIKTKSPSGQGVSQPPATPLKREGTFTIENPDETPKKRTTMPSPGCTPFHSSSSLIPNVTRSIKKIERRSLSAVATPKHTKVMFCSPVNNQALESQLKRKVIKSSLKGSKKSFVFDERANNNRPAARKRSLTYSGAEDVSVKRKRLADELQMSVNRLSRPRATSALSKLPVPVPAPNKAPTPLKSKSETKVSRTKLPNFASLHRRQFAKMESLDEFKERKKKRARHLLTPNGGVKVLARSSRSPGSPAEVQENPKEKRNPETPKAKPVETAKRGKSGKPVEIATSAEVTNLSKLMEMAKPGYTRFGFKLKTEFNPFSVLNKSETKVVKPEGLKRKGTMPSLTGVTSRKEAAKQVVMREKSVSSKLDEKREENRTIIKGVRTNRRFDLQMRLRNLDG